MSGRSVCFGYAYMPLYMYGSLIFHHCCTILMTLLTQATKQKFSARHAFLFVRECYQKEGLFSLWRGNSATMARIIPYAAIQFAAHEQYKRILRVDAVGNE